MLSAPWFWWLAGYLAGSIPFGLLIGFMRGVDIRDAGSGNIGATNAGRVLGKRFGLLCFTLDVAKGWAPVLAAGVFLGHVGEHVIAPAAALEWLGVAAAAMCGHMFPIWLKFKGGKGVATGFGVMLGVWPMLTLPVIGALIIWIAAALTLRYVSLASMLAAVAMPILVAILAYVDQVALADRWPFFAVTILMALLVVVKHRTNITRLLAGDEPCIGQKDEEEALAEEFGPQ